MAAVDTKKPAPVNLSAKSNAFQFNADSPSFVPNTSFDPKNLPPASTKKKLTFYSPSQFYPKQQPFYYANGYGADGAYYGAYDMFGNAPLEEEEEEAEIIPDVIVFKNLPFSMTDDVLMKETVNEVGTCIDSVTLVRDKKGRFKGTAFVKFNSIKDADGAMEKMNDVVIMGRQVKLEHMHANGIKMKKKKKKKKKKKGVGNPPTRVKAPQSIDSPETSLWIPAEGHEKNMHKVCRRKSRGNSDMDVNWRSKTAAAVDIEMPDEPESRALCQKLVQYKKSTTSKPTMITACSVDHLKQLIRVSNLLNLNHQIEEATGTGFVPHPLLHSSLPPGQENHTRTRFICARRCAVESQVLQEIVFRESQSHRQPALQEVRHGCICSAVDVGW